MGRNRVVNNDCAVIYGNTNQQDTVLALQEIIKRIENIADQVERA